MRQTKAVLVELGQEALSGGDAPAELRGKYHKAVIEQYLGLAYADVLQTQFDEAGSDFTVFDNAAKRFKCTIALNEELGMKYFDLPASLIPMKPKQAGLRSISMLKGQQIAFAPIGNASIPMWDELEAMKIDNTCSYMIEGNQVVLYRNAPDVGSLVLVKMIVPFSELDDDDDVTVPGGKNSMLFQSMYGFMSLRGNRKDEYNNNNSTQKL